MPGASYPDGDLASSPTAEVRREEEDVPLRSRWPADYPSRPYVGAMPPRAPRRTRLARLQEAGLSAAGDRADVVPRSASTSGPVHRRKRPCRSSPRSSPCAGADGASDSASAAARSTTRGLSCTAYPAVTLVTAARSGRITGIDQSATKGVRMTRITVTVDGSEVLRRRRAQDLVGPLPARTLGKGGDGGRVHEQLRRLHVHLDGRSVKSQCPGRPGRRPRG